MAAAASPDLHQRPCSSDALPLESQDRCRFACVLCRHHRRPAGVPCLLDTAPEQEEEPAAISYLTRSAAPPLTARSMIARISCSALRTASSMRVPSTVI